MMILGSVANLLITRCMIELGVSPEISLVSPTSILRRGSNLVLDIGIRNTGQRAAIVDGRFLPNYNFKIVLRDAKGKIVKYPGWNTKLKPAPFQHRHAVQLQPNCKLSRRVTVGSNFVLTEPGRVFAEVVFWTTASEAAAKKIGVNLSPVNIEVTNRLRIDVK